MANINWPKCLLILSIATVFVTPINGVTSQRKLLDDTSIKCGCSSCTPCYDSSPPPPPVLVLPPPPPKKLSTPSLNCPPPPLTPFAPFVYVPSPPGKLYPIDSYFSGSHQSLSGDSLAVVLVCGFVGFLMAFW